MRPAPRFTFLSPPKARRSKPTFANRANNANLSGNYGGCVFLQECNRVVIRGITARNYHGDGLSWQVCHDVLVENCLTEGHSSRGLHPGSGSQRPIIRNNRIVGNDIGLFFCWGVKFGLAEGNTIEDSRQSGISIGHRDTENLVRKNIDTLLIAGTSTCGCVRGTVLDGYSYGYPVFPVEECIFDRSRTSHLVNLFEMNAKYASVIQLSEALDYVSKIKRLEGRKALAS